eukprot:SAG11_NODE_498_length_8940_cov_11.447121_5_plen_464_part_00
MAGARVEAPVAASQGSSEALLWRPICGPQGGLSFKIGAECDIQDKYGRWYAGRIVEVTKVESRIGFSVESSVHLCPEHDGAANLEQDKSGDDDQKKWKVDQEKVVHVEEIGWMGNVRQEHRVLLSSPRLAPAGTQHLSSVHAYPPQLVEQLAVVRPEEVFDLPGTRCVVWWPSGEVGPEPIDLTRGEWWGAECPVKQTKRSKGQTEKQWEGWYRFDFDAFIVEDAAFDTIEWARQGRIRRPVKAFVTATAAPSTLKDENVSGRPRNRDWESAKDESIDGLSDNLELMPAEAAAMQVHRTAWLWEQNAKRMIGAEISYSFVNDKFAKEVDPIDAIQQHQSEKFKFFRGVVCGQASDQGWLEVDFRGTIGRVIVLLRAANSGYVWDRASGGLRELTGEFGDSCDQGRGKSKRVNITHVRRDASLAQICPAPALDIDSYPIIKSWPGKDWFRAMATFRLVTSTNLC